MRAAPEIRVHFRMRDTFLPGGRVVSGDLHDVVSICEREMREEGDMTPKSTLGALVKHAVISAYARTELLEKRETLSLERNAFEIKKVRSFDFRLLANQFFTFFCV